ncbi:MAG: acetylglutamate kinase [Planctomycetes bacterium]|nr:acetylglutamate kinase [Planctomycetota bacterium]
MDVVKLGGAEGVGFENLAEDVATRWRDGWRGILCHGGSDATNRLSEALGRPPEFVTSVSGHVSRRCDRDTLEVFAQATALVNRRIVERLQATGVNALGLSGIDGRIIEADRKAAIRVVSDGRQRIIRDDWTGRPTRVNATLLRTLVEAGYLPVIAPLALSPAGEMLNIDGDRGAALVASTLAADALIILTNVPGLLRRFPDESTLIRHVPVTGLDDAAACAEGRMRKKVLGAREALDGGVARVVLSDARHDAPLTAALAGAGTVIGAPLDGTTERTEEAGA